jgi:predicted nucleic acid-binding protein
LKIFLKKKGKQKGRKRKEFLTVVDTGVLVEYINESGEYHDKVKKLLEENNTLYVTPITLSEVIYVSYRIYKASGLNDANKYARDFVEWGLGFIGFS